jgi:hypothetical protein
MKVSKNHEVCARCHLMGDASGDDCTIMSSGVSGVQNCMVAERTARKRASNVGAEDCAINMAENSCYPMLEPRPPLLE